MPVPRPPPCRRDSSPTIPVIVDPALLVDPENDVTTPRISPVTTLQARLVLGETELEQRERLEREHQAARARLEREVVSALESALARTQPERGAPLRWLLVGVCLGALTVYLLMASALRQRDLALAALSAQGHDVARGADVARVTDVAAPAPMCKPPEEARTIPTFDVEQLPRVVPPAAPVRPPKIKVEDENPYADLTP